jgi:hypothetical protein
MLVDLLVALVYRDFLRTIGLYIVDHMGGVEETA